MIGYFEKAVTFQSEAESLSIGSIAMFVQKPASATFRQYWQSTEASRGSYRRCSPKQSKITKLRTKTIVRNEAINVDLFMEAL